MRTIDLGLYLSGFLQGVLSNDQFASFMQLLKSVPKRENIAVFKNSDDVRCYI